MVLSFSYGGILIWFLFPGLVVLFRSHSIQFFLSGETRRFLLRRQYGLYLFFFFDGLGALTLHNSAFFFAHPSQVPAADVGLFEVTEPFFSEAKAGEAELGAVILHYAGHLAAAFIDFEAGFFEKLKKGLF